MEKKYSRTNIYIMSDKLWKWAKFRADTLGKNSVSEYIFKLINLDRNGSIFESFLEGDIDEYFTELGLENEPIQKVGDQKEGSE